MYKPKRKGAGQLHIMEKEAWKQIMQHQLKNRTGWRVLQATDRAAGLTRQGWSFSLELKLDWKRIRCAKCTFMSWRLVHKPTPTVKHHHLYWGSWSRSRQWCETIIDKETWCHLEHPKQAEKSHKRSQLISCADVVPSRGQTSLHRTPGVHVKNASTEQSPCTVTVPESEMKPQQIFPNKTRVTQNKTINMLKNR